MSSDVPEGWGSAALGDVIRLEYGRALSASAREPGQIPVYGSNGVCGQHSAALIKERGIVVGRKGTAGSVNVTKGPFWPIDTTYFVVPRVEADFDWLAATLEHARLSDLNEATGVPGLNRDKAYVQPILLPPLDEQRRIAEVLRSIDNAIQAASDVAAASFDTLTRVRDELICLSAYETVPLVELTDEGLFTDGDWVESKDQDPNGEVRLIQLADIGDGNFIDKSRRFLTMGKARQLRCTFLQEGDLLVARMPDPLGRCCLLPPQSQPCVTVVDVCVIRAGPRTSNRYLAHAIGTSEFRTAIVACASGTTRTRVSRGNLGQLRVPLPSPGIQQDIIDALDQMALVSEQEQQAVEKMLILKHEIMSDLLSGRVRVPA